MHFSYLIRYFEKLEKTSSMQALVQTLALLLKEATAGDIEIVCYFTLGEAAAAYKNVQLGIGTRTAESAISLAFGIDETEIKNKFKHLGDY